MKRIVAVWVLAAVILGACGLANTPKQSSAGGEERFNWSAPLTSGVEVRDVAAAHLHFSPIDASRGLGSFDHLFAAGFSDGPAFGVIAWVINNAKYGLLDVTEHPTTRDGTMAEWEGLVARPQGCSTASPDSQEQQNFGSSAPGAIDCHIGDYSFMTLSDGSRALITKGPEFVSIAWLEDLHGVSSQDAPAFSQNFRAPALEVVVMGPDLNTSNAGAAANDVVSN